MDSEKRYDGFLLNGAFKEAHPPPDQNPKTHHSEIKFSDEEVFYEP